MAKRKTSANDETLVDIVEVKESAESFVERNQQLIFGGLVALVLLVGGYFAYKYLFQEPKQKEAVEQMYKAQEQFERDSFRLALTNPGSGFPGFLDIIDQYSGTPAANAAEYYAGICYLQLGEYDAAIAHLNDFSATDEVLPITKMGAIGDAYAEKGDLGQALSYYKKAVSAGDNDILTAYYLKKVGMLNEKNGEFGAAKDAYEQIRKDYPNSNEGRDIEKYIARVSK
ncbi:MAG: tetratricopeptide repeat protein [Saprospiraceae bacterium]|nr:tetratricopeptide repeat protein [Saprospiraceae bacterium]